jgi:DNA-binding response OmpR family regulator
MRVAAHSRTGTRPLTPKATIVFADDEPPLRELAEAILGRAGYKVVTVATRDALRSLVQQYPGGVDLLLTDVVMPGVGGPELVGKVKARWPGIRVLYVSGYASDQIEGLDPHAAFLQKPFTPAELLAKVAEVLGMPPEEGADSR